MAGWFRFVMCCYSVVENINSFLFANIVSIGFVSTIRLRINILRKKWIIYFRCVEKKFNEKFDSISCPKIRFVKLDQERNYDINKSTVWRKRFVTISKICLKNSFIQKLFNLIQLVFLVLFLQKSKLYT